MPAAPNKRPALGVSWRTLTVVSADGSSPFGEQSDTNKALAQSDLSRLASLLDPHWRSRVGPPNTRPGTVDRLGLGGLVAAQRPTVAAVSAPAGYGKSTLLVEWARQDGRPSAWVSLDRTDNDPVALFGLVATALDQLSPVDPAVFNDLASSGVSVMGRVVPRLAAWMRTAGPFLLLLDDLHEVDDQECRDAFNLLVDHLAPGSTVAAASRGEVWFDLARRRAQGQLLEIGPRELAFDSAEAAQLLAAAGVELASAEVDELRLRTEGWPAGLYLGALALRDTHDVAKALEMFAGDDRFVADYLRSEILDRAPTGTRLFLTRTAVLDQLSGPLCDQVIGSTGSAAVLSSLEQSNLFLVPLDHRRQWYRYHGLFRDLLLAELARAEPELVPELHRRAADWYEANGGLEAAMGHARASGDTERAARLFGRWYLPTFFSGGVVAADRWLRSFSEAEMERYPWLAVLAAWIGVFTGRPVEAARWAEVAERCSFERPLPDGSTSLGSARATLRAVMCPRGVRAMVADAEFAESEEPPGSPRRRSALHALFWARQLSGDEEAVEIAMERWLEVVQPKNDSGLALVLAERSLLAMARGDWEAAAQDVDRARACIAQWRSHENSMAALTFAASARLAVRDRDLAHAREYVAHAMRLRAQATWAQPSFAVRLRLELARLLLAMADPAGARGLLREIDDILRHRPDLGVLVDQVEGLRHQLATMPPGKIGVSSLSPAELRLLPYLQTHLTHEEIGQRLYVSLNTVRTQTQSIYRKLDVSSRADAVDQARRVGLLTG